MQGHANAWKTPPEQLGEQRERRQRAEGHGLTSPWGGARLRVVAVLAAACRLSARLVAGHKLAAWAPRLRCAQRRPLVIIRDNTYSGVQPLGLALNLIASSRISRIDPARLYRGHGAARLHARFLGVQLRQGGGFRVRVQGAARCAHPARWRSSWTAHPRR